MSDERDRMTWLVQVTPPGKKTTNHEVDAESPEEAAMAGLADRREEAPLGTIVWATPRHEIQKFEIGLARR